MRHKISIIGIGEAGPSELNSKSMQLIQGADTLAGGERLLAMFPNFSGNTILIKNKISELADIMQQLSGNIVVLASGDPLFFGIAALLTSRLELSPEKKFEIEILPSLSSIQLAFARFNKSWHDATSFSLHGRSISGLAQKIIGLSKVFILTDPENNPGAIAKYLLEFNLPNFRAFVAEDLAGPDERCREFSLEELSKISDFHSLNVLILENTGNPALTGMRLLGIPDGEFSAPKPERGLITKKEIRVQIISALKITVGGPPIVFWDIGACTGSVSIEVARMNSETKIFAVEKNEERLDHCRANMRKFSADFALLHASAPDSLENLEDPHAVFIGGSSGSMAHILEILKTRLCPGGVLVVAAATIETLEESSRLSRSFGWSVEITQVSVSRSKPIGNLHRLEAHNPVFIIQAIKPEAE